MRPRLLLVDSSPAVQRLVEHASTAEGFEVTAFRHAQTALEAATRLQPSLIVADYHLEDMVFSAFCERLRSREMLPQAPIIALLSSSDRLDDRQIAALGVRAVLKKPLQSDDLVEMVRSLRARAVREADSSLVAEHGPSPMNGTAAGEPVGSPAKLNGSERPQAEAPPAQSPLAPVPPAPAVDPSVVRLSDLASTSPGAAGPASEAAVRSSAPVAEAMRGIFAQLLQSMTEQTERTVSDQLPDLVAEEVRSHLPRMVRAELPAQVESTLPPDQLATLTQVMVQRALPDMVREHVAAMEPMIRETITATAGPLVREIVEKLLRELVEATLPVHLSQALARQLGPLDQFIKETAEAAALRHAKEAAETIVREVARDVVKGVFEQAIREMATGLGGPSLQNR